MAPAPTHDNERSVKLAVIAVHGTFANGAPWAAPTSSFRAAIESHLQQPLDWIPFGWSGGNTHSDREQAATALGDLIVLTKTQRPDSKIYLVGHSHGGNVALMTLAWRSKAQALVEGVICLSTPFFKAELSEIKLHQSDLESGASLKDLFFGLLLTLIVPGVVGVSDAVHERVIAAYCVLAAVVYPFALCVKADVSPDKLKKALDFYRYKSVSNPVLAIRVEYDEALWHLKGSLKLSDVPATLANTLRFTLGLGVMLFPVIFLLSLFSFLFSGEQSTRAIGTLMHSWFHFGMVALAWSPVIFTAIRLSRTLLRMGPITLGEGIILGHVSKFKCEPWPSSVRTLETHVLHVQPTFKGLRHSAAYQSDECAQEVALFMLTCSRRCLPLQSIGQTTAVKA